VIAGCGLVTEEHHLPAALGCPMVEVIALVDPNLDRARRLARKFGCHVPLRPSLDDVVDAAEGVLVATPNHAHGLVARQALERGRSVLVEKPLAISSTEANELCRVAERNGAFISVGFVTRFYPVVTLLKRLLDERFFGRVERFDYEHGTVGGWSPQSGYNLDARQSGGGVLLVQGTHFIDRMLHWFGEPASVSFADDSHGGVEATCRAELRFDDGLTGTMFLSKTVELRNRLLLETERGRVELPAAETHELVLRPRTPTGLEMRLRPCPGASADPRPVDYFQLQVEEFARVIRQGGAPKVDGVTAARSVRLCEALYAARTSIEEPWLWYRDRR